MGDRICVTGGTGFIGSHLVASLKQDGHWVRAVDIRERAERKHLYGQADELAVADLTNPENWWTIAGVDRIYHLAADHGGAGYFHSDRDQPAARRNMQMDLNVLAVCEAHNVKRLFYASSFCAYPVQKQDVAYPLSEDELFEGTPEACYGSEKRFMTQLCTEGKFDARCGVFATIFGPLQESEGLRAKFPTAISRRALESSGGPIELWGDGTQVRTFLYIDDAIKRIRAVMETDHYEGPVNIASDEAVTVLECARWACENADVEPVFDFRPDKPTGVAVRIPDNSMFERLYGVHGTTKAKDGFAKLSDSLRGLLVAA